MPTTFADRLIDDAVQAIQDTDLIAAPVKPRMIAQVLAIRQRQCLALPSCGACAMRWRCEDRIGAILNGEVDAAPANPGLWLVEPNAA